MPTSIHLDPQQEERLDRLAKKTGRSKHAMLRQMIDEGLDDIEDAHYGALALEAHYRSGERTYSAEEVMASLGLDPSDP